MITATVHDKRSDTVPRIVDRRREWALRHAKYLIEQRTEALLDMRRLKTFENKFPWVWRQT